MKNSQHTPSATSLPRAPREGADSRTRTYLVTMGIRVLCFALMVLVTPYGWWTWVFGAAAIFLPYIAVVFANVDSDVSDTSVESPERALPAAADPHPSPSDEAQGTEDPHPMIIRIHESPAPREDPDG
ncbi:DUF3099 domain-containing protein [Microbacterium xanthum]|uniref:DUF3099 domain-containing protein n=1 Tax=Microbacterium xanthum TaxID=3079794 RepID=UPI002AD4459B|nr:MULTISPECIES: DUF3099 domain-containing protein [unclassified Microbacterium]MDZ8172648.1 DUF3099 domain-containing protein [Microbacterium sp. KSW-48]MDZ8202515.1 DUF3099 domain-containing protein [Microbacterium sp. SSW1-59]